MPKGLFTASSVVLCERMLPIEVLAEQLDGLPVLGSRQQEEPGWFMSSDSIVLDYRPEVEGKVVVDMIDQPWPDTMGDPQRDPELFAAWAMQAFGPSVFPGNLDRARQQAWGSTLAAERASRHAAFIRIRASYVLGLGDEARILPADYDPLDEVNFIAKVARALLDAPGALCFFNPNGEKLHTRRSFDDVVDFAAERGIIPIDLWANVRIYTLPDNWILMDTVGLEQIGMLDHEACFARGAHEPDDISHWLRSIVQYQVEEGVTIGDGHTADGPNGIVWQCREFEESLAEAPRPTLRWFADDGHEPPMLFRTRGLTKAE